jgi:sulfur relay (sulfurtransferase) complex TusBCD TusD component (DsrE family)
MDRNTVLLFTRNGLGQGPEELQQRLVIKFLGLLLETNQLPAKMFFYTDAVKLACEGSIAVEILRQIEVKHVELILCKTCLDYLNLTDRVQVGIVGSMADIIEGMQKASKVISV